MHSIKINSPEDGNSSAPVEHVPFLQVSYLQSTIVGLALHMDPRFRSVGMILLVVSRCSAGQLFSLSAGVNPVVHPTATLRLETCLVPRT